MAEGYGLSETFSRREDMIRMIGLIGIQDQGARQVIATGSPPVRKGLKAQPVGLRTLGFDTVFGFGLKDSCYLGRL